MVKTATNRNGDTKTATDCPDQNGDKLKWRQAKNGDRSSVLNEV